MHLGEAIVSSSSTRPMLSWVPNTGVKQFRPTRGLGCSPARHSRRSAWTPTRHAGGRLAAPHAARSNPALLHTPDYKLLSQLVDVHSQQQAMRQRPPSASGGRPRHAHIDEDPPGDLLDSIFDALSTDVFFSKRGFVIPKEEAALINATGGSSTYGELLPEGVDELLEWLDLDDTSVFLDAGCGTGQALLHVAMAAPHVRSCVGIDLSETRLEHAELALATLDELGRQHAPVTLRHEDLATADLSEATHVYFCSTAFGAGLCRAIAQRLAASPALRVLVTSRALPANPYMRRVGEIPLAYSYMLRGQGHVYVKADAPLPLQIGARLQCDGGLCWAPGVGVLRLALAAEDPLVLGGGIPLPAGVLDAGKAAAAPKATGDRRSKGSQK